jgi:hypothetical protein
MRTDVAKDTPLYLLRCHIVTPPRSVKYLILIEHKHAFESGY